MYATAHHAYAKAGTTGTSARHLEGFAFAQAARKLQSAASQSELRDALAYNLRLWTTVQAAVTDPANTLPADLKAKLLSLSMFVDKRVSAIMANECDGAIDTLIEVNRAIAAAQLS